MRAAGPVRGALLRLPAAAGSASTNIAERRPRASLPVAPGSRRRISGDHPLPRRAEGRAIGANLCAGGAESAHRLDGRQRRSGGERRSGDPLRFQHRRAAAGSEASAARAGAGLARSGNGAGAHRPRQGPERSGGRALQRGQVAPGHGGQRIRRAAFRPRRRASTWASPSRSSKSRKRTWLCTRRPNTSRMASLTRQRDQAQGRRGADPRSAWRRWRSRLR